MKRYSEPWNEFAGMYSYYTSPTTPSRKDLDMIRDEVMSMISEKGRPDALILGCTAGYRKMLARHGIHADLADLNRKMLDINNESLKGISMDEGFIRCDWRDMNLKKKYDIILGDFAVNNIHKKDKSRFYRNIIRHLKDDGSFITRIAVQPKKPLRKEQVFRMYRNKRISRKSLNELHWDAIFNLGLDSRKGAAENRKGFAELSDYGNNRHMEKWVSAYSEKFPTVEKEWSMLKEAEQDKELKRHFRIIRKSRSDDYKYSGICPTYVLKRKYTK
ncbi:methyltransferase domain-containing protein [Candidatus Woesearchaeota archaeon]|nr:methyltransferase domain-containing protein [Candidatus Woesearchaeota archaeon]